MKIKSLYISAQEKNVGMLFVSMGMMEILKRNLHRVAFFRPVIETATSHDKDIDFILQRYGLDMDYEDAYGFDIAQIERMIAFEKADEVIKELIKKFKKLEENYDFVLCEGIPRSLLASVIDYDLNISIAQNFSSPMINIINAKERSAEEIYENILIEGENLSSQECPRFTTVISRVDEESRVWLQKKLGKEREEILFLPEIKELSSATIDDIAETLDAKVLIGSDGYGLRSVKSFKVAAFGVDTFLSQMQEDDLVILPAERSDIVLGTIGAFYSNTYPKISALLFVSDAELHPNMQKMLLGLKNFTIPVLWVDADIYETVKKLSLIRPRVRVANERKIAQALGLFHASIDVKAIEKKLQMQKSEVITPMMFAYKLFESACRNKKRIVLPESSDERILRACEIILRRDAADIILLGDEEEVRSHYQRLGLDLNKAVIVNPYKSKEMDEFANLFYEMRKSKGLTLQNAKDAMMQPNYFATMMVHTGAADAMVSGAIHSTADTLRPALQIIKTTPDVSLVSSLFFICLKTKVLVYGDCALNQNPNAAELAQIALSCAATASYFGIEPKVAMLSYSTGESGSGEDVQKVREATKIAKSLKSDLEIEGPIQYDAAIDKEVAMIKLPNSKVAGEATVFIFPDLNTGNNTYKAVQRSSGAVAIGPVLQGLKKPVNDLSRGCSVEDIVNTILITAIQAGQR